MARVVRAVGWMIFLWTAGIAVAAIVVALTGDCSGVAEADFHVCELNRNSNVSSLVMVWFIGALPLGIVWLLLRGRRGRCRVCGQELGAADRRICRRCATRMVETAQPRH
jgi:hypothetical protein